MVGFLVSQILTSNGYPIEEIPSFNDKVFFYICVPILVFSAGFSMHKQHFFRNIRRLILFGVIGTFVQFILSSLLTHAWVNYFKKDMVTWDPETGAYAPLALPWPQIMIMCALLVATDEIATESFVDPNEQKP